MYKQPLNPAQRRVRNLLRFRRLVAAIGATALVVILGSSAVAAPALPEDDPGQPVDLP